MKPTLTLSIGAAVLFAGCVAPTKNASKTSDPPAPLAQQAAHTPDAETLSLIKDVHQSHNEILQFLDPEDIIVIQEEDPEKPGKPKLKISKAGFGIARMVYAIGHHPYILPEVYENGLVGTKSSEFAEIMRRRYSRTVAIRESEKTVQNWFIDKETLEMSKAFGGSWGPQEYIQSRVLSIIKNARPDTPWSGYIGSLEDSQLYIFPIKAENDTCIRCHTEPTEDKPISYIAYYVMDSPLKDTEMN